jgi:hypothetical protein
MNLFMHQKVDAADALALLIADDPEKLPSNPKCFQGVLTGRTKIWPG